MDLYALSVPVFRKGLLSLKTILKKGEDFAREKAMDPETLLSARLAPDMFPLVRQVQIASDNAKGISARLAGLEPPQMLDNEKNFAELYARIDNTLTFLDSLKSEAFQGGGERLLPFPYDKTKRLLGKDYLLEMSLPNFFFHVVTAYSILRNQGVPLGKNDYIGPLPLKEA